MDWIQVTIGTTSDGVEAVTGRLLMLGITGTEIEDGRAFREFLRDNTRYWDYVDESLRRKMDGETRVKVYVAGTPEGNEQLLAIRESMRELKALDTGHDFGSLDVGLANMSEEDWANNWKQYFKPIAVGNRVLIRPEWEPLPEDTGGRVVFTVDPGMTFGTGAHETTRLCIRAEENCVRPGGEVLDIGSGSGILSVVSLLLGARHATAVDIDPNAARVALHNAALNGIGGDRLTTRTGDILTDTALRRQVGAHRYDLVLANIVADVIIALAPAVPALLREDGFFVCSGIIDTRCDEVEKALAAAGLRRLDKKEENGWVCFTAAGAVFPQ